MKEGGRGKERTGRGGSGPVDLDDGMHAEVAHLPRDELAAEGVGFLQAVGFHAADEMLIRLQDGRGERAERLTKRKAHLIPRKFRP